MKKILAFIVSLFFSFSYPASATTPASLTGTWQNTNGDKGTITVTITKTVGASINGTILLTGSEDCTETIPFRGTTSPEGIVIIADAPGVCGHDGILSAKAFPANQKERSRGHSHVGTFTYKLFGLIWQKGTFALDDPKHE